MEILLLVLAIFIAICLHEGGHAIALIRSGLDIEEIGIGFPLPKIGGRIVSFKVNLRGKKVPFSLYLFLLGAFVKHDEKALEKIPVHEKMRNFWSGPYANIVSGLAALLFYRFSHSSEGFWQSSAIVILIFAAISIPYSWLGKKINLYFVPGLSILILAFVIWSQVALGGEIVGPIGMVAQADQLLSGGFVYLFIILSLSLGVLNLAPIPPLDGGRAILAFLEEKGTARRTVELVALVGLALIGALFSSIFANDIANLIR